ncbi:glycosyltransferase family 4 protein [Vibrio cholerae]|nr:glycosyltransferase family 4 protein [Vibrio cholerae]
MKVAILGNANSIHVYKWVEGLFSRGIEVHLLSCHHTENSYSKGIHTYKLDPIAPLGYIFSVIKLRKLLDKIRPDILHAHYVTGYGTLATLSGYSPRLLSAWGADVYDFPQKSRLHHWLVEKNLSTCNAIGSTSICMSDVIRTISSKLPPVYITPFGVDTSLFFPKVKNENKEKIVLGTVKFLHAKYGIDILIRAFDLVLKQSECLNIELVIVGSGPEEMNLKSLASELGISHSVRFEGYVDNKNISQYINEFDIFIALSRLESESFGVAVIEASSCGIPVVVSNVSGFKEVVVQEITGIVVQKDCPKSAADAISRLVSDHDLRQKMGCSGRVHVMNNYSWDISLNKMICLYNEINNDKLK